MALVAFMPFGTMESFADNSPPRVEIVNDHQQLDVNLEINDLVELETIQVIKLDPVTGEIYGLNSNCNHSLTSVSEKIVEVFSIVGK